MGRPALDLDGQRFGRLVATNQIKRFGKITKRLCRCDCGNETWQPSNHLTSGHTKSCGCWLRDVRLLEPGQAAKNQVLDSYKRGASDRNLKWLLSDREFDTLVSGDCYYCGSKPNTIRSVRGNNGEFIYNGIDRIDNLKDYIISNCVSCCPTCNRAKSDMNFSEFIDWAQRLGDNISARH